MPRWHDWDSTVACEAASIEQPTTEDEVVAIVRRAIKEGKSVRTFGAGHSWSPLVPSDGILVNLDHLSIPATFDGNQATISAGMRLRDAGPLLQSHGLTFQNVGAITPQSVAGAAGSGTHGTGLAFGIIGSQFSAVRIVDGRGELRDFNIKDNPREMAALRLSLGSLGVIVRVTVDCVPDYDVELTISQMEFDDFIKVMHNLPNQNDRVRAYWFPGSTRVAVHKMKSLPGPAKTKAGSVYSWFESVVERKWILGAFWGIGRKINPLIPTINRIEEIIGFRGKPKKGHCFDAITTPLPPFHQEAEIAVPLENASKALVEYRDLVARTKYRVNVPSEIRYTKGDDILLSPGLGVDTCYIGGYNAVYHPNDKFFEMFCTDLRDRFDARPHWGKIGAPDRAVAQKMFPGFAMFEEIRREFDPNGVFLNGYLRELFGVG